jgi:hypothetical protein
VKTFGKKNYKVTEPCLIIISKHWIIQLFNNNKINKLYLSIKKQYLDSINDEHKKKELKKVGVWMLRISQYRENHSKLKYDSKNKKKQ